MKFRFALIGLALGAYAAPALAQDAAAAAPFKVSGSAAIVSDYSFRGVSQSNKEMAVQAGITVAHESGFYVGTWGSNLAGWGTFGGANMELDLIGGYKLAFEGGAIDAGLTWYMYPGGFDNTDFAEPYVKLSGTVGPVGLTAGVAYAPKQQALGPWYTTGADAAAGVYNRPNAKKDNLYLAGDGTLAVPNTPFTAKAHIGYSKGNPGLGPFATSVSPTGEYWDWMLGADAVLGPLTLGVAYVDTDISRRESAYLEPSFSKNQDGTGSIADGRFVFTLTAAF